MPRLGLDFFLIEGFSFGGSLVYWRTSGETEAEPASGASVTSDDADGQPILDSSARRLFLRDRRDVRDLAPRRNHLRQPEGRANRRGARAPTVTATTSLSTLALSLDVPVVISPIENFAILIGPFVDLGVSGTRSQETDPEPTGGNQPDPDAKLTSFGLAMGIAGYY